MPVPTLLGVPYDAASSYLRGAADAPPLIRQALHSPSSNLWTEELTDLGAPGTLADAGDVCFADGHGDPRAAITAAVRGVLDVGGRPLVLGGDHSITYPVLRAVRAHHPRLSVLHVDAHADLYDAYEGDRHSHASPFARIMEEGLCDQLVQVGIRTLNAHQRNQAQRFGVEVIRMAAWEQDHRPRLVHPVYLSLDLDGLDPAFAPGVSHHEPGGLTVREVVRMIQSLDVPLVGADVVEYNPRQDVNGMTATVAGKLVKELAAMMLASG